MADAVDIYLKPPGIKPTTLKRYRTVLEHFCEALGANTSLGAPTRFNELVDSSSFSVIEMRSRQRRIRRYCPCHPSASCNAKGSPMVCLRVG